eukprot:SAG25_NODE_155_length_13526_cov_48.309675_3_plen_65_part_00
MNKTLSSYGTLVAAAAITFDMACCKASALCNSEPSPNQADVATMCRCVAQVAVDAPHLCNAINT